jgi:hypothetical protein
MKFYMDFVVQVTRIGFGIRFSGYMAEIGQAYLLISQTV